MARTNPTARDVAVYSLRDRSGNVSARLDSILAETGLAKVDRNLARQLALGVVRRRETLRSVLRAFLTRPDQKLPAPLANVLLVGLYQILFCDRIPAFAAVNEAVEQAGRMGHRRRSGLVNGLLRGVAGAIVERQSQVLSLAGDVIPVGPNATIRLDRPVFPDPASSPAEFLAQAFSLPDALAERWLAEAGSLAAVASLATHANAPAPLIMRVNRLRAAVGEVLARLAAAGIEARPHANGVSVVLAERAVVTELDVFADGWVQVQDATATAVGLATGVRPGMNVLDFCAAPGTKTTHLAELMDNAGSITACDVSPAKLQRIEDNCRRMGISIVTTRMAEEVGGLAPGSFDVALVDAPCSNTGVLARRAEARWRFDPDGLVKLAGDQRFLAAAAAGFVRSGGRLVYSTCSLEPEECSRVVQSLGKHNRELKLISQKLTLPGGADDPTAWRDGGYVAVFEVR